MTLSNSSPLTITANTSYHWNAPLSSPLSLQPTARALAWEATPAFDFTTELSDAYHNLASTTSIHMAQAKDFSAKLVDQVKDKNLLPVSQDNDPENYSPTQNFFRYFGFPLVAGASILGGWQMMEAGFNPGSAIIATTLLSLSASTLIEHYIPYRSDWINKISEYPLDILHNLFSTAASASIGKTVLFYSAAALAGFLSTQGIFSESLPTLWSNMPLLGDVSTWHPLLQFGLALTLTEFFTYCAHRGVHEIPGGWNLHRIHHRPEKLNTWKAGYNNFIDSQKEMGHAIPLFLMGVDPQVVGLVVICTTALGFLQHSAANFHLGAAEYIVSGTKAHRWHHARDERHNTNYGINLMIYDTLSALPDSTLDALLNKYPNLQKMWLAQKAKGFTSWLNSLYMPEENAPQEVGIEEQISQEGDGTLTNFLIRDNLEAAKKSFHWFFFDSWGWAKENVSATWKWFWSKGHL